MSTITRISIAVSALSFLVIAFLHNPFDGWDYRYYVPYKSQITCDLETYDRLNKMLKETYTPEEAQEWLRKCLAPTGHWEYLPFSQWRSENPNLQWFSSVKNCLIALSFSMLGVATVYFLFKPQRK